MKRTADQEKAFRDFVQNWLSLLAQNQFGSALDLLDEPNSYGYWWTVEDLRGILRQPAGSQWLSILKLFRLSAGKERIQLLEMDEKRGYILEYAAPLMMSSTGRWQELALRFAFRDKVEGYYVVLQDIRVN